MKTLLLCGFLVFGTLKLNSQNLNTAYHSYVDRSAHLVSVNSKYFHVERVVSFFGDSCFLVGLNSQGKRIWRLPIALYQAQTSVRLLKTLDNCLWVAGYSWVCDTRGQSKNFFYKVDTNGVVKFQTITPLPFWGQVVRDGLQYTDSSYYHIADSALVHYSKTGQFISKVAMDLAYPTSIALLNNGNFLVNGKDANMVFKHIEVSVTGAIVNQQNANPMILSRQQPNGIIYGLTGRIEKINASFLTTISTSTTLSPDLFIYSYFFKNDSLFFTGRFQTTQNNAYGILDQNLNLLFISQASYRNMYPLGITVDSRNKINILTTGTSTLSNLDNFTSFYQFPLTGTFVSKPDVGVQSFSLVSASYTAAYNQTLVNLKVTVKNYSNDTIKNFYLNSDLSPGGICSYYKFHKRFSATILPNSSVEVETGDFRTPYSNNNAPIFIPDLTFPLNICLFTSVPNQETDSDISNDRACDTVHVLMTAIGENTLNDRAVKIYPNPFDQVLKVESEIPIKKIGLFNATGALVKEIICGEKTFYFDNQEHPAGIYLIKIETEKGMITKKVIRE